MPGGQVFSGGHCSWVFVLPLAHTCHQPGTPASLPFSIFTTSILSESCQLLVITGSAGPMQAPSCGVSAQRSDLHLVQVCHYISACHRSFLIHAWQFITNACSQHNHYKHRCIPGQNLVIRWSAWWPRIYLYFLIIIIKKQKIFKFSQITHEQSPLPVE